MIFKIEIVLFYIIKDHNNKNNNIIIKVSLN